MPVRLTTSEFIKKAKDVHGNTYDYSLVDYKTAVTPVVFICAIHGKFKQQPTYHVNSIGCPKCGIESKGGHNRLTTDEFIEKAKIIHGEKYDYSLVVYYTSHSKVKILCKKHNYIFTQVPNSHLGGSGCPKCKSNSISLRFRKTTSEFIEKAKRIHGEKYDYSITTYTGDSAKLNIICEQHGIFNQKAGVHLSGHGCQLCGSEKISKVKQYGFKMFYQLAMEKHGSRYDYNKNSYLSYQDKVEIICKKHGKFTQAPTDHINLGHGCPECSGNVRKTNDQFIRDAKKIHGEKFDYSKSKYINHYIKVEIACSRHGIFWQSPGKHISSEHGCPKCAKFGFDQNKPGFNYVHLMQETGTDLKFVKYGITNVPRKRKSQLKNQIKIPNIKYEILETYMIRSDLGSTSVILENKLHDFVKRNNCSFVNNLPDLFDGKTETVYPEFYRVLVNELDQCTKAK